MVKVERWREVYCIDIICSLSMTVACGSLMLGRVSETVVIPKHFSLLPLDFPSVLHLFLSFIKKVDYIWMYYMMKNSVNSL